MLRHEASTIHETDASYLSMKVPDKKIGKNSGAETLVEPQFLL